MEKKDTKKIDKKNVAKKSLDSLKEQTVNGDKVLGGATARITSDKYLGDNPLEVETGNG